MAGRSERDLILNLKEQRQGNALLQAAQDLEKMSHGVDAASDRFQRMADDAKAVDLEIEKVRAHIKDLNAQFAATGDVSLFKDLRYQRSKLSQLERISKEMGLSAGPSFVEGLVANIGELPSQLKGVGIVGGTALAAAAAPVISGVVAASILGAAGAGGVVGGAILAAQDQRVKDAWGTLGQNIMAELRPAQEAFVGPTIEAAQRFGDAFDNAGIVTTLTKASTLMKPLANAAAGLVERLGPGLSDAIDGAEPVLRMLERELPDFGEALGDSLTMIANVGPEAATALGDVMNVVEVGVTQTAALGAGLTRIYDITRSPLVGNESWLDMIPWTGIIGIIGRLGDEVEDLPAPFLETAGAATQTADAINILNQAFMDLQGQHLDAQEAADRYKLKLIEMRDKIDENGTSLADNTEKGLNNRLMVEGLIGDLQRQRDANIKANMPVDEANRLYADQVTQLQILLGQLGFNKDAVAALVGEYKKVPPRITTEIITHYYQEGFPAGEHSGIRFNERGKNFRAAGGPVLRGEPYMVGEQGMEVFVPDQNGTIIPNHQLRAMSGGSGGQTITVILDVRGGDDDIKQMVKKWVALDGGGDVQVALGRRS